MAIDSCNHSSIFKTRAQQDRFVDNLACLSALQQHAFLQLLEGMARSLTQHRATLVVTVVQTPEDCLPPHTLGRPPEVENAVFE